MNLFTSTCVFLASGSGGRHIAHRSSLLAGHHMAMYPGMWKEYRA